MKTKLITVAIALAIGAPAQGFEFDATAEAARVTKIKQEVCDKLPTADERTECNDSTIFETRAVGVRIGMTMKQVLATQWSKPNEIHRTTTAHGVREQWVYGTGGERGMLYFDNGVLTAIQN